MIREGFVTFTNARYLRLSEVLVRGLLHFSTRPVIVYGVNTDIDYAAPNLITRRIDCPEAQIYTAKFHIMRDSGLACGVFLDADQVPNAGVDRLFTYCDTVEAYPLIPRHPAELGPQQGELMQALEVYRQSLPYVQTCCMVFSQNCLPFIEECARVSREVAHIVQRQPGGDEPLVNVLLWKHNARRYLDCCNIDSEFYESYMATSYGPNLEFQRKYGGHGFRFTTFHYCKDPERAASMLQGLIARHGTRHGK